MLRRSVEVRELVTLGFSRTTAKRALKALELGGSVRGGAASPALLEELRNTTMATRAGAVDLLDQLFGEGEQVIMQITAFIVRMGFFACHTNPRPDATSAADSTTSTGWLSIRESAPRDPGG
jgi:hypothetical protein